MSIPLLSRRVSPVAVVSLVLAILGPAAMTAGQPAETLTVTVAGGGVSLEAVDAPLDQVLIKIGEALHARIVIETVLAGDLGKTRVTRSFRGLSPVPAFRRLLDGRNYALVQGPNGVDEVRIFVDGRTGYRDLTPHPPGAKGRPATIPLSEGPPDDAAEVARLREAALGAPDASARRQALEELSSLPDTGMLRETLTEALARERDGSVLETVLEVAAQNADALPSEALRAFVASDRDGTVRAMAVDQLAAQAGDDPATRTVLRALAASDASADVREAAQAALQSLETPAPAPPPPAAKTRR